MSKKRIHERERDLGALGESLSIDNKIVLTLDVAKLFGGAFHRYMAMKGESRSRIDAFLSDLALVFEKHGILDWLKEEAGDELRLRWEAIYENLDANGVTSSGTAKRKKKRARGRR